MNKKVLFFFVLLTSFLQHYKYLSLDIQGVHTWRQTQTMWNVRNFARHDANILNPRVNSFNNKSRDNLYRYEFPLMQWSIAMFQKLFGEKIALVRILLFIIGAAALIGFFLLMNAVLKNWICALMSTVLLQYSPLFFYYTINPIPDNLAFCSSIWYLLFAIKYYKKREIKYLLLSGVFLCIATAAKLPFLMFSIVSIFYFVKDILQLKRLSYQNFTDAIIQLALVSPALLWYAWVIPTWKNNPVLLNTEGNVFDWNEHMSILYYHATEMFPNILLSQPTWLLFILGIYVLIKKKKEIKWLPSLILITFLYLAIELKPIGIVHDYYMFPFLCWLYIIVGLGVDFLAKFSKKLTFLLLGVCILSAINTASISDVKWSLDKTYFNKDVFIFSEELKNATPIGEKCIILNDHSKYIFSYRIDKMGHVFWNDHLPIHWIKDMILKNGVRYMYSDSRIVDETPEFKKLVEEEVLTKGTVKVFKLKNNF